MEKAGQDAHTASMQGQLAGPTYPSHTRMHTHTARTMCVDAQHQLDTQRCVFAAPWGGPPGGDKRLLFPCREPEPEVGTPTEG